MTSPPRSRRPCRPGSWVSSTLAAEVVLVGSPVAARRPAAEPRDPHRPLQNAMTDGAAEQIGCDRSHLLDRASGLRGIARDGTACAQECSSTTVRRLDSRRGWRPERGRGGPARPHPAPGDDRRPDRLESWPGRRRPEAAVVRRRRSGCRSSAPARRLDLVGGGAPTAAGGFLVRLRRRVRLQRS